MGRVVPRSQGEKEIKCEALRENRSSITKICYRQQGRRASQICLSLVFGAGNGEHEVRSSVHVVEKAAQRGCEGGDRTQCALEIALALRFLEPALETLRDREAEKLPRLVESIG